MLRDVFGESALVRFPPGLPRIFTDCNYQSFGQAKGTQHQRKGGRGRKETEGWGRVTSHLWAAPPSFTWVTTIAWGERFDPRPPLTWIPSPSDSLSSSIFHIRPTSSLEEKVSTREGRWQTHSPDMGSGPVTSGQASITYHQTVQVSPEEKVSADSPPKSGCQCPIELSRITEIFCLCHSVGSHGPYVAMECLKMCGDSHVLSF